MRAETALIGLDQPHLPDGGGGLEFGKQRRPLLPAEALDALGDGAAGDQHDLFVQRGEPGDLRRPQCQALMVEAAPLVGYQAAADFHHQAASSGHDRTAHAPSPASAAARVFCKCSMMANTSG